MPKARATVTVDYDVYRGEDPREVLMAAQQHAQNLLFEQALLHNHPMPTEVQVRSYVEIGRVEAYYDFEEEAKIVFMCPLCEEQIIGTNKDQIRDLLAKHYELMHEDNQPNKEQDNA